ncbi:50S ribosomal protein L3 [Bacillota bacterium LX-D]|nr:50S ribosomal protein L3 [Bacillota bacterium LX-D]
MTKGILAKKIGMTQIFMDGKAVPVTVIEAGPCYVIQKKTVENDGYNAIQVGFVAKEERKVNKPLKGHFAKAKVTPFQYIKEFKVDNVDDYQIGQEIKVDLFADGDNVDVIGTSKGKGFTGTIKRYNFQRGPMGHGSKNHRRPASAGAKGPARVFKGKKSPGRSGGEKVTIQNLQIAKVDTDRNLLLIKGSIPGPNKSMVIVRDAVKAK